MRCRLAVILLLFLVSSVRADERILSFHSDINVNVDGSIRVTETIKVRTGQDRIQHGLYRDFPTMYEDRHGNRYRVDFNVGSVQRDGRPENFFTEAYVNGIRTYFGRKEVMLSPGEYSYVFTYTTGRQLGFFERHDELYWNVTGNGWEFPIDHASVSVFLPGTISSNLVEAVAWTGEQGSTRQDYREDRFRGGSVFIETTGQLGPQQGLTIAVSWPKGYITEPSSGQKLQYFYRDNRHVIIGAGGLVLVFAYYLVCWMRSGRDPEAGVILTQYQPPAGYSPASLRYIERMGYDRTCFAAALINLAVKGYLKISEEDGDYMLVKTGKTVDMSPGEAALTRKLFGDSTTRQLRQANHLYISEALKAHESSLQRNYEKVYFVTNRRYFIIGLGLTFVSFAAAILMTGDPHRILLTGFATVWLSIWSFAVFFLLKSAIAAWRNRRGVGSVIGALYMTGFAAVFTGAEVGAIIMFSREIDPATWMLALAGAAINWMFYEWLKAPTLAGRKLLDLTAGFRHYLEIAEKHELAQRHPGGRNPELFENYLPYALAFGIEQRWAEKFADVLTKVSATGTTAYHPVWYSGSAWDDNHIGGFATSLGEGFPGAIASSSMAPGSTSAGGGGGSSGGGGGGGGGGGW